MANWFKSLFKSKSQNSGVSQPGSVGGAGMDMEQIQQRLQSAMLCKRAISHVEAGDRETAAKLFQQAVTVCPSYGLAWSDFGTCLVELGRYEQAADVLKKATEMEPRDGSSWIQRCKCLTELGRKEEARRCLLEAKRIVGSHPVLIDIEIRLK